MRISIPSSAATAVIAALAGILALSASAQEPFNFDDFDDGFADNNAGGSWHYWDDSEGGGNSRILSGDTSFKPTEFNDSSLASPGQGGTEYAARIEFIYGDKKPACGTGCTYDQEVGIGSDMRTGEDTAADITGATHISFWVKASVPMKTRFMASTADIADYSYYGTDIALTTDWKEHKIDLKSASQFAQPAWATAKKAFNFAKVTGLEFAFSKGINAAVAGGTFYVDNLKIHGWTLPVDPVAVRRTASHGAPRLLALGADGLWTVSVPASASSGSLSAYDMDGSLVAVARFKAGQASVPMDLRGHRPQALRFRVSASR